jgi:deoxyguanosine kinase
MHTAFLGIGTNLGNREINLQEAMLRLNEYAGAIMESSSVYETESWGFRSENDFLNITVRLETELSPSDLLDRIMMIESLSGRVRDGERYSSRILDIDILLYDDLVVRLGNLEIPHPRMHERKFVLVPLDEIAPGTIHPVFCKSIRVLLGECKDKSRVIKI